jgi:hypothetical protein
LAARGIGLINRTYRVSLLDVRLNRLNPGRLNGLPFPVGGSGKI